MYAADTRYNNLPVSSVINNNSNILSNQLHNQPFNTGINQSQSEFIYCDLIYSNDNELNGNYEPVVFSTTRTQPIIERMELYKVGVISITGNIITPLITDYGGCELALDWTQNNIRYGIAPYYPWTSRGFNERASDVFSVTEWLIYMNINFILLWDQFRTEYTNNGGDFVNDVGVPRNPPFIVYDEDSKIFKIYVDINMENIDNNVANLFPYPYNGNNTLLALMGMDKTTSELLFGIPSYTTNNSPYVILYPDPGIAGQNTEVIPVDDLGGVRYIVLKQDLPTTQLWNRTNSLLISSNFPVRRTTIALDTNFNSNSKNTTYNILETFPLALTRAFNRISEYSKPNIDYVDITGNGQINELDFRVYTLGATGELRPLYVAPKSTVFLRLVFTRCMFTSN